MARSDDYVIEIPVEDMQLGFDTDGLPRVDPGVKTSQDKPAPLKIETADADDVRLPVKPKGIAPKYSDADYEAAKRRADEAADRASRAEAAVAAERSARADVEKKLSTSTDAANRQFWGRLNSDFDNINGAIALAASEKDAAKSAYKAAFDAGDSNAAADAQDRIAVIAAKMQTLESGKHGIEAKIDETRRVFEADAAAAKEPRHVAEPKNDPPQRQMTVDDYIGSQPRKTTGAWLADHKDYVSDPAKHKELLTFADEFVKDYGPTQLHTKAFVDALNERFNPTEIETAIEDHEMDDEPEIEVKAAPKAKPKTTAAAPVSRNANTFSSRNMDGNKIKLPPHIADFVRTSGLDPVSYAQGLVKEIKAGKLPKNYLDHDYQHETV